MIFPSGPGTVAGQSISFRELRTVSELAASAALRYRVYHTELGLERLASLDPDTQLDVDVYDLYSRHYGLFASDVRGERLVGTLRITGSERGPLAWAVEELADRYVSLRSHIAGPPPAPLPMLCHLPQALAVRGRLDQLMTRGERIAEPGRLTVEPLLRRTAARSGVRLSHFLMACAEAVAWQVLELDRVFVDCDVRLEPFYRGFGFDPVPGGEAAAEPDLGISFLVLQATARSLPLDMRSEVDRLARQLRGRGVAELEVFAGELGADNEAVLSGAHAAA
jgi:hypothetical protein